MRFFKRKSKGPVKTGKVIDMTHTSWGHNISMNEGPNSKGEWRAAIWNATGAAVGDELIYRSGSGMVRSIITNVEPTRNVWDMYFINAKVTHLDDKELET